MSSLSDLKEEAKLRAEISVSLDGYLAGVEKLKTLQKTIKDTDEYILELENQKNGANAAQRAQLDRQINYLKTQTVEYERQVKMIKVAVKEANKYQMATIAGLKATANGFAKLPGLVQNSFGKLKGTGLFEMDKAIKMSALQMGLLGNEGKAYNDTITRVVANNATLGVGVEELGKMQADYAEGLGRTVMLGDKGLKSMAQMSVVTGLGAEGTTQMAIDMEEVGYSAEKTGDYIEKSMNSSHKMGINASKVIKNVQGNIKLLNKYNFKDGVKGLDSMAKLVTKLGIDMKFATGMADKLWDIEGAVDMSAQLQVMGGEWAKMADPFHLMYMARNDMEGLTKEIANASQASMHFAKDGSIEMSSLEMSRLKIIAKETGLEYDDLVKSGKELFKMNAVKKQIGFGFDKDTQEFISNTAQISKDGKATIEINGSTKLVSQLNGGDLAVLKQQITEKKSMEERAEASKNFDDQLTNLINQVKTYMLPIITGINETLGPIVTDFMKDPTWKDDLRGLGINIKDMIIATKPFFQTVGSIIQTLGPTGTLAVLFGGKVLFNAAQWFINGVTLGKGFVASSGGIGGALGGLGKVVGKLGGYVGLATSAFQIGADAIKNAKDPSLSGGDAFWKTVKDNAFKIGGGVIGGIGGALVGGPAGAMIGAGYGSQLGGMFDAPSNDAIFGSPLHDGLLGASMGGGVGGMFGGPLGAMLGSYMGGKYGSDFSKGRGIIQGGKVHPIDNKDDLLAMKKGGVVDKANQSANIPATINHTFEAIEIRGSIMINTPGNPGQGVDLLKNGEFIRNITSMIHSETQRQIGGGKNKG